jgi:wobble nucleotide-excising tRNase
MKITRINKIKGHRVFENFTWPSDLPDFARFNLIYGWNGSGKTTISNLLRCVQMKTPISEGEVDFHIDGNHCPGNSLAIASGLPQVRVFNREFVETSVFSSMLQLPENPVFVQIDQLRPIFFLGKESVEKQKQVEELARFRLGEQQKLEAKIKANSKASKALDDFCIREAKAIKDLLSSSGTNRYNNYDKSNFKDTCAKLGKLDPPPTPLTDPETNLLKQQKDSKSKEAIATISLTVLDLNQIRRKNVEMFLQRTVVSQVLKELLADAPLAEWVHQGLGHHSGKKYDGKCRFCDSMIPEGRIVKLEAHFNDEYNNFLIGLDSANYEIVAIKKELAGLQLPDKARFYEHLISDYEKSRKMLDQYTNEATAYLTQIAKALTEKRTKPFEKLNVTTFLDNTPMPDATKATVAVNVINDLILRHNTDTQNFHNIVADARKRLEEGLVAEALADFKTKSVAIQTTEAEFQELHTAILKLNDKILALEKEIVEHRQPAEELNVELRSYLGRDELKFDLYGNGYQITRHGKSAKNLSEGERTAIAFLYFLKSLQAKDFTIANDIIVIDDPVSSLDANSLFCAFGYMKERTKKAGQLFILTHNFALFRQVKNWFNHLPHQGKKGIALRPARFYMIEARFSSGKRNAELKQLDPLLHQFESEYHYLFKQVHDEANGTGAQRGLEEFYGMPNIARRLLESFLAFRYPAESGELKQQLDLVAFDTAKKARILRFLHTYSHDGKIAEPEHDLSILAETPDVLKDLIELLKAEDPKHYDEMVKLLSSANS